LMRIDQDDKEYAKYLTWKQKGYSDDFKALGDLASTHSSCRVCILAADRMRRVLGPNEYDERMLRKVDVPNIPGEVAVKETAFSLYIRERGQYIFTLFRFARRPAMAELVDITLEEIKPSDKPLYNRNEDLRNTPSRIYTFYSIFPRHTVLTDGDINSLPIEGVELEVIFV